MQKLDVDPLWEVKIIERILGGDSEAFSELVDRYQGPLLGFLRNMIQDRDAAQDIAQETFVKAFLAIREYEGRNNASFSSWLFTIARNACLDALRKRKRKFEIFLEDGADVPENPGSIGEAERHQIKRMLEVALNHLGIKHRMAFELTLVQGFTYEEAAEIMQSNPGTVRSRVNHARTKLKEKLQFFSRKV